MKCFLTARRHTMSTTSWTTMGNVLKQTPLRFRSSQTTTAIRAQHHTFTSLPPKELSAMDYPSLNSIRSRMTSPEFCDSVWGFAVSKAPTLLITYKKAKTEILIMSTAVLEPTRAPGIVCCSVFVTELRPPSSFIIKKTCYRIMTYMLLMRRRFR